MRLKQKLTSGNNWNWRLRVTPHLLERAWSIDECERKRHRISDPPLAVSIAEATEWLVDGDISSNPIG